MLTATAPYPLGYVYTAAAPYPLGYVYTAAAPYPLGYVHCCCTISTRICLLHAAAPYIH